MDRRTVVVGLVAVLLLAACLRAPVTAVGPLMERIGADTGLSATALGLLGALPVLGFGLGSALVHRPATRFGLEPVIAVALLALTAGIVLRSVPVPGLLWVGSAVLGLAIAAGNVLAPAVIKRDHPRRIALLTACFTAVMSTTAATAAGVAVPLSDAWGGDWARPLGVFAVVVGLVALLWVVRALLRRRAVPPGGDGPGGTRPAAPTAAGSVVGPVPTGRAARTGSMWRSPSAWAITAFMGLQSSTFYLLITWLPTIEGTLGIGARTAGWHVFLFQVVGMLAGLVLTVLMRRRTDLRTLGVSISLFMVAAMVGLHQAPDLAVLWVVLAAMSAGSSLVLALSLFGLRTAHPQQTAQLSAMAQTVGYIVAAAGPLLAGWIGSTFGWSLVLVLAVAIGLTQTLVALGAARPGLVVPR